MPAILSSKKTVALVGGKNLFIPDRWTAETFAIHGAAMILTLARVGKIAQRQAVPILAGTALKLFNRQLRDFLRIVLARHGRSAKPESITIDLGPNEHIFAQALNEVFREAGIEAVTELSPPIQSVMAQGYSKTSLLLNQEPRNIAPAVAREAREIARRVTAVTETTRKEIEREVRVGLDNRLSVAEVARNIEQSLPRIFGNRALTIARTELNRAWTWGALEGFRDSHTITHLSVIGCEAREPRSPHYQGQSTCNYPDLPIAEIDAFMEVGFHPNHTGNVVPSGFRNADGTDDPNAPRPDILDDQSQAES